MEESGGDLVAVEHARIAGFWRRVGAFLIDTLILGVVGWALGLLLYDQLAEMGGWALVLGFAISLAYFACFDGPFGPSPGKRALAVRVVDRRGRSLSLAKAAGRCAVLQVPYYLNGAPLPAPLQGQAVANVILYLIVFGLGGAMVYLILFNRTTRQSLHDLVTGTFVVEAAGAGSPPAPDRMPRLHALVAGGWMLSVVVLLGVFHAVAARGDGQERRTLEAVAAAVETVPGVRHAIVTQEGWPGAGREPRWYSALAVVPRWPEDRGEMARKIVEAALAAGWTCGGDQRFVVVLRRGFAMGIASAWRGENFSFTCREWIEERGVVVAAR